ncbi:MAG TPA: YdeI/OmpD-associated family protein [Prolixibacteraceae bacterium]|nr:YdeI/OmpD-associated family protein [Prolixibacteraceae bacterium]
MSELKRYSFSGEMYQNKDKLVYIDFPYDAVREFGTAGKIKIKAWIDGQMVRKSLVPKGNGVHRLAVTMDVRMAIGKGDGDTVDIELEADNEPRIVPLPEDLEWLLDNEPDMKALFLKQAYSTQLFFATWIAQTKDPDARVARINHLFYRLRQMKP